MTNIHVQFNWHNTRSLHELVKTLSDLGEFESIAGTVAGRKHHSFLKEQTDINYDPLYCVQDIHDDLLTRSVDEERIREIEENYGTPFLWKNIIADRHYYNYKHDKQKLLLQGWFDFYLDFFNKFEPDIHLTSDVDSTYTMIPFDITQREFGISMTKKFLRIEDRIGLCQNKFDDFEEIHGLFSELKQGKKDISNYSQSRNKAKKFIKDFRSHGLKPSYASNGNGNGNKLVYYLTEVIDHFYRQKFGDLKNDFYHNSTSNRILSKLKNVGYQKYLDYLDIFQEPIYSEDYIYFPLHLQPEASTSVLAPMYMHQRDVIRDLSKSIPFNYKLYVKEHPSSPIRNPSYYKELAQMPNVVLLEPNIDSHKLIKHSKLITTITGTAGLEAVLSKKPSIVFGRPHYRKLSMVSKVSSRNNISNIIKKSLNDHSHNETELIYYLTALYENSYSSLSDNNGETLENMASDIITTINQ
ncbi:hypothetical protein PNP59_11250 [Halobacterium salinarum]|uniref:capsular polysaccharide export protein, LipB/KpsS family n=1 Tax=Halobacterium salinarum TaxID=2242 RepID=UPI0025522EB6|nr:hypothetical protein [Halobacterium salinarum]MDL0131502.1 hypothetical protein [Halobacterium salinarum]